MGTYKVWHADLPGESVDFPEAFTKVATVEAKSLEQAATLTRHINRPWQENPGVQGEVGARSTTIGDVIVTPTGTPHRIEHDRFVEIEPSQEQLFREWRHDTAQRPLHEKGVWYEDEIDRHLDQFSGLGQAKETDRER